MRVFWIGLIASVMLVTACRPEHSSPPTGTSVIVAKRDLSVGATGSIAACGLRAALRPGSVTAAVPPGLSPNAPASGDVVSPGAVSVAVCPIEVTESSRRHPSIEITGRSLDSLVTAINAEKHYDGNAACTADQGWTMLMVFRYRDGRTLPLALDSSGCGLADNGAQQRFGSWERDWEEHLSRATGGRD